MPCERGQLGHAGVLPGDDLVLAVAMCAHNLVGVLAPQQIAHLAPCTSPAHRVNSCISAHLRDLQNSLVGLLLALLGEDLDLHLCSAKAGVAICYGPVGHRSATMDLAWEHQVQRL